MSENYFRRISRNPGNRKIGEAPNIGKVSRSPMSAVKRTGKRRRKSGLGRHKEVIAWSMLLAFVSICGILSFAIIFFRSQPAVVPPKLQSTTETRADEVAFPGKKVEQSPLSEEEAVEFVRHAMQNRDSTLVTKFFRLGKRSSPTEVTAKLDQIEKSDGPVVRIKWFKERYANDISLQEIIVFMDNGVRRVNRIAQIFQSEEGEWRIDFDSYIRASSTDWKTILSGSSPLATVRVFVTEDAYYNGIFMDDTIWKSYSLISPDADDLIYAYVKIESAQHKALDRILLSEGDEHHRATLEIRRLPGAGKRQFEINRVLAENWVVSDEAFDAAP